MNPSDADEGRLSDAPGSHSHLVITVHGIRTFGDWQGRLESLTVGKIGSEEVWFDNYQYGFFSVVAFIIPILRWLAVRRFRSHLVEIVTQKEWKRVDLVGHSFGTHIIAHALMGLRAEDRPKINTVLLAGSVLKPKFRWADLAGCVQRVANDCGSQDSILLLNQFTVFGTGMAGREGFVGGNNNDFRNRFHVLGHSGFFRDNNGLVRDDWMTNFWLPLLCENSPIEPYDERPPPTFAQGVLITIARYIGPIKLTALISPFVLAFFWIVGLYLGAAEQKRAAQGSLLSARAIQISRHPSEVEGFYDQGVLLAVESVRLSRTVVCESASGRPGYSELERDANLQPFWHLPITWAANRFQKAKCVIERLRFNLAVGLTTQESSQNSVFEDVRLWIADGLRISPSREAMGALATVLAAANDQAFYETQVIRGPRWPAGSVALATDERTLMCAWEDGTVQSYDIFTPSAPQSTINWSGAKENEANKYANSNQNFLTKNEKGIWAARFGPSGNIVLNHFDDRWNSIDSTETPYIISNNRFPWIKYSDNGKWFAAYSNENIYIFDIVGNTQINTIPARFDWDKETGIVVDISSLAISSRGDRIAVGYSDGSVELSVASTGKPVKTLQDVEFTVSEISFDRNGRMMATGDREGSVKVWNAENGEPISTSNQKHEGWITSLEFAADSSWLASGGSALDPSVRVWDPLTGTAIGEALLGHRNSVVSMTSTNDGRTLISASVDGTIRIWSAMSDNSKKLISTGTSTTTSSTIATDSKSFATGHSDGTIQIWDAETGLRIGKRIEAHHEPVTSLAFRESDGLLASGSEAGTVKLWNINTHGQLDPHLRGVRRVGVAALSFANAGKDLRVLFEHGALWQWDMKGNEPTKTSFLPNSRVYSATFSADGRKLSILNDDTVPKMRFWDASTGNALPIPKSDHKAHVWTIALSDNGEIAASSSLDPSMFIWSTKTGERLRVGPSNNRGGFFASAFGNDNKTLATIDRRLDLQIWDIENRKTVGPLIKTRLREGGIPRILISRDGTKVLISNLNSTQIHHIDWSKNACDMVQRNLSCEEWQQYIPFSPYRVTCSGYPACQAAGSQVSHQ